MDGFYFTWPLRKQAAYKQATRGPTLYVVLSEGLGNEDKVPCPRALLPLPADSNRGPHYLESVVLSTEPQQLLTEVQQHLQRNNKHIFWGEGIKLAKYIC